MSLRHVDPMASRGPFYRAYAWFTGTSFGGWMSKTFVWKLDPILMRLTGGRLGMGFILPTALLETRGARSGAARQNVVLYFHDGERVVLIASKLGLFEHPAWFHNARANPEVTFGGEPFRAGVVEEEAERARLWGLADRVFPPFASYRERAAAADRTIPILRLTPR